ncbi:MAG: hypothetical protein ACJASQ_002179 [Crocinitomicaceae bacterium]|jgi:hypothetical protein
MKFLIVLFILIGSTTSFSQSEYTDTVYYKTGMIRAGIIFKETNTAIRYNYLNNRGKVMTSSARKSMLNKYTVGDKENSVATDFTSTNLSTTVQSGGDSNPSNQNNTKVRGGAGAAIIGGGLAALGIGFLVTLNAILN